MKRTNVFYLVMAIFWTVIGIGAVLIVGRAGLGTGAQLGMLLLAFVAVAGNWMRYFRNR